MGGLVHGNPVGVGLKLEHLFRAGRLDQIKMSLSQTTSYMHDGGAAKRRGIHDLNQVVFIADKNESGVCIVPDDRDRIVPQLSTDIDISVDGPLDRARGMSHLLWRRCGDTVEIRRNELRE